MKIQALRALYSDIRGLDSEAGSSRDFLDGSNTKRKVSDLKTARTYLKETGNQAMEGSNDLSPVLTLLFLKQQSHFLWRFENSRSEQE
jgi:hypothetical protein